MRAILIAAGLAVAMPAYAADFTVQPETLTEWKAVYGRVETRDTVPARARIGGVVVSLEVSEGDTVTAGQKIATVRDDKLAFQIAAIDAKLRALQSRLKTAEAELDRAQTLVQKGVLTKQRLDQLTTEATVARNDIAATEAEKKVLEQQGAEGDVLAPVDGTILTVPVTKDAVIMGGEPVATVGGGGFFLRLAIPERHASLLKEGAPIRVASGGSETEGKLAKVYPLIQNGRVVADVQVGKLNTSFVDARTLVRVPVGERSALVIPKAAVTTRWGIDFVPVKAGEEADERAVILGEEIRRDGVDYVEVLTGLEPGETVVAP